MQELHLNFVIATANLHAHNFGLTGNVRCAGGPVQVVEPKK